MSCGQDIFIADECTATVGFRVSGDNYSHVPGPVDVFSVAAIGYLVADKWFNDSTGVGWWWGWGEIEAAT